MKRKRQRLTKEIREAIADRAWWEELCKYLPWKLHGYTYRSRATFWTGEPCLLDLHCCERIQILEAIHKGVK